MQQLRVTLETVTPLFLGGADPRGQPELRAPSVRGALRFWLRALLGGVLGDSNLDALRQAENSIFGSTDTGASPVVVRLIGEAQGQLFRPLLHSPSKNFTFPGVPPGKRLTLALSARPPHPTVPDGAIAAALVFALLGGLGKRSRRGFGSFVLSSNSEGFPLQPSHYATADSFFAQLSSLINDAVSNAQSLVTKLRLVPGRFSSAPDFPVLHQQHAKVLFCREGFNNWEEAMKNFWTVLRSNSYRDNPVFGFAGKAGRQASPLHLRIVKIGNAYHLLLTVFHIRFAGQQQPKWDVMRKFLDKCCKNWDGVCAFGSDAKW